ncbi:MAG: ThuA domain-containing protein [Fibrobacteria bacterium]
MQRTLLISLLAAVVGGAGAADRILIFTKTAAYREDNIAPTRLALKNFYAGKGLTVDTSENASLFTDTALVKYKAIVFLKTSGDALDTAQQSAFEKWFLAGGGFQGIHSALDTEYDWPFYGKLIAGAWYESLPGKANAKQTEVVEDTLDISTLGLPRRWNRTDEIYAFKANPRAAKDPAAHILVTVDEATFTKGVPGTDHPMSWYVSYQGGRAWTTAMGHVTAAYSDPLFLGHLWGGMQYILKRPTPTKVAFPNGAQAVHKSGTKRAWTGNGVLFGRAHTGDEPDQDVKGRTAPSPVP